MCTSPLIFSNIWVPLPSVDIKSCRESNLKCWLWTQVYGLEIVCHKVSLSSFGNYSTPSISSAEPLWVREWSWSAWEDGLCKIHSIKCKMFKNCVWQLKCSKIVFLSLKCLKCRISFFIKHFTRSVDYNIFVATTYLLRPPSKHRQRCLAPAERKVVPPQPRGPSPPLPLCNFGSVTFHPNTL